MAPSDEYEKKIANTIEEIYDLQLEALRRAGVAKEKEKGLEIESTEAVRLFREATGYLLRLQELREDVQAELQYNEYYNASHILGHLDDYNRILEDLRGNNSFKSCIDSFEGAEYSWNSARGEYRVTIEGRSQFIADKRKPQQRSQSFMQGNQSKEQPQTNVPMEGSEVETFVLPRLSRVTKDVENSIIGRCASGKRP